MRVTHSSYTAALTRTGHNLGSHVVPSHGGLSRAGLMGCHVARSYGGLSPAGLMGCHVARSHGGL